MPEPAAKDVRQVVQSPIDPRDPEATQAREQLFVAFGAYDGLWDALWTPQSITEALPHQLISRQFGTDEVPRVAPASESFVIGSVESVEPGLSVRYEGEGNPVPVDYFATEPHSFNAVMSIRVQRAWGKAVPGELVEVAVGSHGLTPEDLLEALASMGDVAVAYESPVDYPGPHWPLLGGALLGQVDAAGNISFPGIVDEAEFMGAVRTAADIDDLMNGPAPETVFLGSGPA